MKLLGKIWWTPFVVYMVVITAFMSDRMDELPCRKIEVEIRDSLKQEFVTTASLMEIINSENYSILGQPAGTIDIEMIESRLDAEKEIKRAEVYMTLDGTMHVFVDQRDPVMRVITTYGNSYYIDREGYIFPFNRRFTPRLIVVTGNVEIPDRCIAEGSLRSAGSDSDIARSFELVKGINRNDFWRGQIEQVWITSGGEFELVPRVGAYLVKFGTNERQEEKLRNLEAFYRDALPKVGWNRYREINLKYEGQIVCRKR